jgi:hypothetical protein
VTRKERPPGGNSRGSENDAPAGRPSAVIVLPGGDDDPVAAKLRRLRDHYGYPTGDGCRRFGQPSNYSLTAWELAAHVRQLRRDGWQGWEVRTRFDFGTVIHAA